MRDEAIYAAPDMSTPLISQAAGNSMSSNPSDPSDGDMPKKKKNRLPVSQDTPEGGGQDLIGGGEGGMGLASSAPLLA